MFRAYLMSFLLNLPSITELHRRLDNEPRLMLICGFSSLPDRSTFSRFIGRLSKHQNLVNEAQIQLTNQLKTIHPDLGDHAAIDSTVVRTHSNSLRVSKITGQVSDPEAGKTAKLNNQTGKLHWWFGYKQHAVVDAKYQIPITSFVTPANRNDSPTLPELMDKAETEFNWFSPDFVMADKGYDSEKNHLTVIARGATLICETAKPIKRKSGSKRPKLQFNKDGVPWCAEGKLMEYVTTHPDRGHGYRCTAVLTDPNHQCDFVKWVDWRTEKNKRIHGPIARTSPEWKALNTDRQSVERVFKSLKEFRRLERHYIRGLSKISLHCAMSVLAYTATVLVQTRAGIADTNWMVKRVA